MTTWRTHRPQPIIPPRLEEQPIIQQDPAPPVIHEQEATDQVVQEERWDAQLRRWEDQQREVARQERGILEAGSPPNEPREHRYQVEKGIPQKGLDILNQIISDSTNHKAVVAQYQVCQ